MPENKQKDGARQKRTARALRDRLGKVSGEVLAQNQARNQVRKRIVAALEQGPQTVPELAEATGLPGGEVLRHLMAMKKYGKLVEVQQRDDYCEYALSGEEGNQK